MSRTRRPLVVLVAVAALAGIGLASCRDDTTAPTPTAPVAFATSSTLVPPAMASTTSTTVVPTTTSTTATVFSRTVREIDAAIADRMRASWRPGCPVPLADLRYVALRHWGTDGAVHEGELVVHRDAVDAIVEAFARAFAARFPIERMVLVDEYGADDQASMRANNTSAFNCREVAGRAGVWSEHAYGRAVDVNPLVNPWVRGAVVDPAEGAPYTDRTNPAPGLLRSDSPLVAAFRSVGWGWGGDWAGGQDWQHFSASGR
jgi:poly-gamma-glutamate synthesis protein (capsule biosynthesis protein)